MANQGATLHVDVVDNTVTLTEVLVDAAGREEHHENKIQADGKEHPSDYGYVLVAKWIGADVLETVVQKDRHEVARVKYEVSADGTTLTVSATSMLTMAIPPSKTLRRLIADSL